MSSNLSLTQKTDLNETSTSYLYKDKFVQSFFNTYTNRSEANAQQKFISYLNQEITEYQQIDKQLISCMMMNSGIKLTPLDKKTMSFDRHDLSNNTVLEQFRLALFESIRRLYDWHEFIRNAESKEKIIDVLRFSKSKVLADRLVYLQKLTEAESEEKPMEIESLRMSALFIMENSQMPNPQITVSDDGLVYLRWPLENKGVLGMLFLPSTLVRFTAILHHQDPKLQRWSVSGVLQPNDMMRAIEPFIEQLMQS